MNYALQACLKFRSRCMYFIFRGSVTCSAFTISTKKEAEVTHVTSLRMTLKLVYSGMFSKVFFRGENVGRHCDFANFWHLHRWIESFFNSIDFIKAKKVDKRLNSSVKMSKICKFTLSADIFTTKTNLGKHSTVHQF